MNLFIRLLLIPFLFTIISLGSTTNAASLLPVLSTCHKNRPAVNKKKSNADSRIVRHRNRRHRLISPGSLAKKLSSRSAIVMDGASGRVLYSLQPDRPDQPASTIKILTGLIAIRALKNHEMVKTSSRAANMPRSKIYLRRGKSYAADDLINAVLLASANDASVALAEKIAGTEKNFARIMTYKAKELGARHTVCKSATGLTRRGQKSTVRDLAVIFNQAMKDKEFAQRIGKTKIRTSQGKLLRNHNKALWRIAGAEGGKTGYTCAARQTYVGQFARKNDTIVVAIMGSETMWDDISRLVDYGFSKKEQFRLAAGPSFPVSEKKPAIKLARLKQSQILATVSKKSKL